MKRNNTTIALLVVLISALCMLGCSSELLSGAIDSPTSSGVGCHGDGVYIYDREEYDAFIRAESRLPEDFITADMLKALGTFQGFICNSDTVFTAYGYSLILENGYPICLRINHDSQRQNIPISTISTSKIGSDMQKLTANQTGSIYRNGVEYRYMKGYLYHISWMVGDIRMSFDISSDWSRFSALSEDTLISKLLSASTDVQRSAVKELRAIGPGGSNLSK